MSKSGKCKAGYFYCYTDKVCKPISKGMRMTARFSGSGKEPEEVGIDKPLNGNGNSNGNGNGNGGGMSESKSGDSSLRDWFGKSKSSDGKPGWVQLGGKYAGKPCARQPGQTTKPKCGSSKMKRNLSKDEEERAFRRKNAKDPNPDRKGKAINVATEEHKKDYEYSMARSELKTIKNAAKRLEKKMGKKGEGELKAWVQSKITKAADYIDTAADYVTNEETIVEKAPKYDKQGLDKFDRSKRMIRHMQDKYGSAKSGFGPDSKFRTGKDHSVANERKAKGMKEEFTTLPLHVEIPTNIKEFNLGLMFRESLDKNSGMLFVFEEVAQQSFHMRDTRIPLDIAFIRADGIIESIKQLEPNVETPVESDGEILCAIEVNRGWFAENNVEVGDEIDIDLEEGKKDACYHKVKSRYSVWPSAYASGALVKCRKVGAKNWGNKTKKEEFSNWRSEYKPTEYEFTDLITPDALQPTEGLGSKLLGEAGKKCWKGYKKAGTQKLFGKTYNRCVKAGDEVIHDGEQIDEKKGCNHTHEGSECPVHGTAECDGPKFKGGDGGKIGPDKNYVKPMSEAVQIPRKTGQIVRVFLTFRGKMYVIQMFFPSVKVPGRNEVQAQIEKVYPGAKVRNYEVSDYEPGQPLLHTEDWQKKSGKNPEGGLNEKGRKSYERENPGSDLKRPSKKVGNPRRKSFCARMKGMKKKLTSSKTANDPDSRINKSLRAWNC